MLHQHTKFGYRRSAAEEISSRIHWNSEPCLWPSPWPQHGNPIFSQDNPHLMMMCHETKFSCKRISSSDDILKRHFLILVSITVALTLKTANQSFWKTIWLIMMHHHIKFGSKRYSVSEDIIWTHIHWHFGVLLWPWPWTQQSNFSKKHSGLW